MNLFEALQQNPHLQTLETPDLRYLADSMAVAEYQDGHTFIREGEPGDTVYLIVDGIIKITREFAGQQQEIERISQCSLSSARAAQYTPKSRDPGAGL
ncbi:MAG: cyclic nucleotide-binding domain-containing protein [Anaerolineae bacterium]